MKHVILYIPIWYNSSCLRSGRVSGRSIYFTFQSGTIQANVSSSISISLSRLYIPIWYNSSINGEDENSFINRLYIPIWYNSSVPPVSEDSITQMIFTFQSGTIQASTGWIVNSRTSYFTFQSGTIQAMMKRKQSWRQRSLHSNLVQFKLGSFFRTC